MATDVDAAFAKYQARFDSVFGNKPDGSYVKFGKFMVQKLSRTDFESRLHHYLAVLEACKRMLTSGSTMSEPVLLEFDEAAAWIVLEAPDLLDMFAGEVGDPEFGGSGGDPTGEGTGP